MANPPDSVKTTSCSSEHSRGSLAAFIIFGTHNLGASAYLCMMLAFTHRTLVVRGISAGGRVHQPKARGETGRGVRFYGALGLVTAATLMLQIIETRIISVTSWYHLAFFVISIAMFGLTAGAVFVYLRKEKFRPERLSYDLAVATLAFALSTDLAILIQLTLVTGASPSLTSLVAWAEFALCLAFPFFFSGVVVSLALTRSPYPIGKVYGADLIGAAVGCIGALVFLSLTSGPSAVLWVGAVIGLAALGFASSGLGDRHESASLGCQAVSLPPQHRHRVPALCDCQHAHDLWRSTDDHQGSLGSDRSCL